MPSNFNVEIICLVISTLIFGVLFSILRFHRRFGRKTRYAIRTRFARLVLVGYMLLSVVFSFFISIFVIKNLSPSYNYLAYAVVGCLSPALLAGASTVLGLRSRDGQSLISIANWIYDSIDPEIERLAKQEMAEIVSRFTVQTDVYIKLRRTAHSWISISNFEEPEKLYAQVAEYCSLADDESLSKLITLLLNDCECDPEWLERMVLGGRGRRKIRAPGTNKE